MGGLPVVGTWHALEGLISGISSTRIKMKDIIVDLGCTFEEYIVYISSNYIAVAVLIYYKDSTSSWMFRMKSIKELQKKPRYRNVMIILKIQLNREELYELVEISQHNLEESIKCIFNVAIIVANNNSKDAIVFTVGLLHVVTSHLELLIYNLKSKIVEQIIEIITMHSYQKCFSLIM